MVRTSGYPEAVFVDVWAKAASLESCSADRARPATCGFTETEALRPRSFQRCLVLCCLQLVVVFRRALGVLGGVQGCPGVWNPKLCVKNSVRNYQITELQPPPRSVTAFAIWVAS